MIRKTLIVLIAVVSVSGCGKETASVSLRCTATVAKSDGWVAGENLAGPYWKVFHEPYSSTRPGSAWEFIVEPNQLVIVSDVVGDLDYCWMQCGPVKRLQLSNSDILVERNDFGGRIRKLVHTNYQKETWELEWQAILGVVISASGRFEMEFLEIATEDPIQQQKYASIDFSC